MKKMVIALLLACLCTMAFGQGNPTPTKMVDGWKYFYIINREDILGSAYYDSAYRLVVFHLYAIKYPIDLEGAKYGLVMKDTQGKNSGKIYYLELKKVTNEFSRTPNRPLVNPDENVTISCYAPYSWVFEDQIKGFFIQPKGWKGKIRFGYEIVTVEEKAGRVAKKWWKNIKNEFSK
jgi:hypothetical protein